MIETRLADDAATPPIGCPRSQLLLAVVGVEMISALANAYCVAHHLPARLNAHGTAGSVAHDWMANGTAIGPPLTPMVLLAITLPTIGVRRWWGALATGLAGLIALAFLFGTAGEPSTRTVFTPGGFHASQAALRLAMIVSAAGLGWLAGRDLISRWRRRAARP